jgi:4,5-dihydroxyphthalate decarboxylase
MRPKGRKGGEVTDRVVLRTALGQHAHVLPLKDGRVASKRVELSFNEFEPLPNAFRHMVRGGDLDVSEMAVVTHLLACHYGRPITGLAIPLWSRLPHVNLVCPAASNLTGPADLEGKRVGVRAYAQTSGVWVRGILAADYGVDLDSITWVTMEDAHLAEYGDPPIAVRNASPKGLRQLMLDGELAAIMGERVVDPAGIRTVIPDAERTAKQWIEKTGIVPINHILSVKKHLLAEHPWLARELMAMFEEARRIAEANGAQPPPSYGLEGNRRSLQMAFHYSAQQGITPRIYEVDELFHPA